MKPAQNLLRVSFTCLEKKYMAIPNQRSLSSALLWGLALILVSLSQSACNCGGTVDPPKEVKIRLTSPENNKRFNLADDLDPAFPGFQATIRGQVENAPAGSTVTLTTNGTQPATVNLQGDELTFEKYTLVEGQNILQIKLSTPAGQNYSSDSITVFVDSNCYTIKIEKPVAGETFGPRDDENTEREGLQKTVEVSVNPQPPDNEEVELILDNGASPVTERKTVVGGRAIFDQLTFPNGEVKITARVTKASGNVCETSHSIRVNLDKPQVTISAPVSNTLLCPADDLEPQTEGYQLRVEATTNAPDGSQGRLFRDGRPFAGPEVVQGGRVAFNVTFTALSAVLEHTLKVTIRDNLENEGESVDTPVRIRTRGYEIGFLGILDGQEIPASRDLDPNTPGVQIDAIVNGSMPDGTQVTLLLNGQPLTAASANGRATFRITLVENQVNTLRASATEPSCNLTAESAELSVRVQEQGSPALTCKLIKGPAFDARNLAALQVTDDTDDQTPGIQNGLECQTDAEEGLNATLSFGPQIVLTQALTAGANNLRVARFEGLTLAEGENKLNVRVTNNNLKTTERDYTVIVDTTPPLAVTDLQATVENHREASIKLAWKSPQDSGADASGVVRYEFRWREGTTIDEADWANIPNVRQSNVVSPPGETETLVIPGFRVTRSYAIAVRSIDRAGNLSPISNIATVTVDFKDQSANAVGAADALYGRAARIIGDLDKDGILDLVVTATSDAPTGKTRTGAVHIYYGRSGTSGNFFPATPDVSLYGEDSNQSLGAALVRLGDLNNDGFDDFAVSSIAANSNNGRVYIVFGGQRGQLQTGSILPAARVIINGRGSFFGGSMVGAGAFGQPDINKDGRPDLLISAALELVPNTTFRGRIYAFFGRSSYPSTQLVLNPTDTTYADLVIDNDSLAAIPGFGVDLTVGDINRDGNIDLIAPAANAHQVLIFFGPLLGPAGTLKEVKTSQATLTIQGSTGSNFGTNAVVVGDIDNDNNADLVISAPRKQSPQGNASGMAFVFSGQKINQRTNLTEADAALSYFSLNTLSEIRTIAPAGDLDKDGYADFLIGDGRADTNGLTNNGAVYLIFGGPLSTLQSGNLEQRAQATWHGSANEAQLGLYSVLGGFDINKDGFDDLLFIETGNNVIGKFYLVY
jgi:hypothetical protein